MESEYWVSVYMPIAGWKAVFYGPEGPEETSPFAWSKKADAVAYAKRWAVDLGVPFRDDEPENTEDANTDVIGQLKEIFPDAEIIELK